MSDEKLRADRRPMTGVLLKKSEFWVRCGLCEEESLIAGDVYTFDHYTMKDAERQLRQDGWSKSRWNGWICEDCKFGEWEAGS